MIYTTHDFKTWLKLLQHLHAKALWSMSQIELRGIWVYIYIFWKKRLCVIWYDLNSTKKLHSRTFKSMHTLYGKALCGWSLNRSGLRGEKICSAQVISDGQTDRLKDRDWSLRSPAERGPHKLTTQMNNRAYCFE